jgi:hypothetical protein
MQHTTNAYPRSRSKAAAPCQRILLPITSLIRIAITIAIILASRKTDAPPHPYRPRPPPPESNPPNTTTTTTIIIIVTITINDSPAFL